MAHSQLQCPDPQEQKRLSGPALSALLGAARYPCAQQLNALSTAIPVLVHSKAFVRSFAFAQYM